MPMPRPFDDVVVSSTAAGCVSTCIGHPLDTVKIHLQTQPATSHGYRAAWHVARHLGTARLFRGMGPPMMNQVIMNTVMFSVFNRVKGAVNEIPWMDKNATAMCAGLISGFATACISTPADWIKIQAQLSQGSNSYRILQQLVRNQQHQVGRVIPVLYRGHVANLGREGVFTMVYLGLYDRISDHVKGHQSQHAGNSLRMGEIVVISAFTGACAWVCNYPFDTVKTVMQAHGLPLTGAIRHIWNKGGLRPFFRGVSASTGRAMVVTSSRMLIYETTMELLRSH
eukprot:TRINITY_DN125665_c0_g1_i1.p1 TRINITY_DN125665_c0_g1~~TRINITY_DN125665_c0_g1_i1.p1  ORF type:complete len:283 (-),score=15.62 TRINITY_DN125665_c0_g1_i1:46-894(-)